MKDELEDLAEFWRCYHIFTAQGIELNHSKKRGFVAIRRCEFNAVARGQGMNEISSQFSILFFCRHPRYCFIGMKSVCSALNGRVVSCYVFKDTEYFDDLSNKTNGMIEKLNPAERFFLDYGFDLERLKGLYKYRRKKSVGHMVDGMEFPFTLEQCGKSSYFRINYRHMDEIKKNRYRIESPVLDECYPIAIEPGDHVIVTDSLFDAFAWMHCCAPNGRHYKAMIQQTYEVGLDFHPNPNVFYSFAITKDDELCNIIKSIMRMELSGAMYDMWCFPQKGNWLSLFLNQQTIPQNVIDLAKQLGDKLIASVLNR